MKGCRADSAAGESQTAEVRRNFFRPRQGVSRHSPVGAHNGSPSLLDVSVFFLVVPGERGRGVGKSSLADLIGFGGDRLTGRTQQAEGQIDERPDLETTPSQCPVGGLGPRLVVCWKMHFGQV